MYKAETAYPMVYDGVSPADADSDGDGVRDGADDQDHDDVPNYLELSRNMSAPRGWLATRRTRTSPRGRPTSARGPGSTLFNRACRCATAARARIRFRSTGAWAPFHRLTDADNFFVLTSALRGRGSTLHRDVQPRPAGQRLEHAQ